MSHPSIHGIVAYPVTPFHPEHGGVDLAALAQLIDRLITAGVHAIAPLGSTGESAYLNDTEWDAAAEAAINAVGRRVPVIVGISDLTTQNAVRRARFAERAGADAVMVLPVSYWKLGEAEITQHYARIAQAVGIPIMLYNNPATSGIDLAPELIVRLVRGIDNITMVKESTGDIQRMHQLMRLSGGAIPFFNGSNPLALAAFAAGATGWCTAAPNLIPQWNLQLYEAVCRGDLDAARRVFYRQFPLLQFILKGGLPTTIKAGLRLQGFEAGEPRHPLLPLGEMAQGELAHMLQDLA
ncbi:dihydrodipicolinate synthase family protein [Chitiniphilus purpureus]|uniref:Dihydrodipicolinate synthase family protein n=1 Tax=Chitiniphilus purpureus TaxID=2981137 RepID=A0ABY6DNU0_9NEIS|nr:dihydrodipicolinate synthase family protein [Chitiniphilus sp. CD1]UXY16012.1 dihydrodipicolinate synthase family protein [Chitiniphilus sp. CD1]